MLILGLNGLKSCLYIPVYTPTKTTRNVDTIYTICFQKKTLTRSCPFDRKSNVLTSRLVTPLYKRHLAVIHFILLALANFIIDRY